MPPSSEDPLAHIRVPKELLYQILAQFILDLVNTIKQTENIWDLSETQSDLIHPVAPYDLNLEALSEYAFVVTQASNARFVDPNFIYRHNNPLISSLSLRNVCNVFLAVNEIFEYLKKIKRQTIANCPPNELVEILSLLLSRVSILRYEFSEIGELAREHLINLLNNTEISTDWSNYQNFLQYFSEFARAQFRKLVERYRGYSNASLINDFEYSDLITYYEVLIGLDALPADDLIRCLRALILITRYKIHELEQRRKIFGHTANDAYFLSYLIIKRSNLNSELNYDLSKNQDYQRMKDLSNYTNKILSPRSGRNLEIIDVRIVFNFILNILFDNDFVLKFQDEILKFINLFLIRLDQRLKYLISIVAPKIKGSLADLIREYEDINTKTKKKVLLRNRIKRLEVYESRLDEIGELDEIRIVIEDKLKSLNLNEG